MTIRILANDGMAADAKTALEAKGFEVVTEHYEPDVLADKVKEFDAMTVRSATKVRQPIIDAAAETGRLKLVIRGGVGIDNIDAVYAEEKGIHVTNTPKASSSSVAELALGHMFSLARYIGISNVTLRQGEWNKKKYEGVELTGKTLGFIGMGRISRELAKRAEALGMNVIYTDVLGKMDVPYEFGTMEDVLQKGDFVTLHIPAPEDGKPVVGAKELALMKPTAFIINTARGGLIDEDALIEALDNGKLAGAAFDVYPTESADDQKLLNNPKISCTPHIGGSTKEAQTRIGAEIVDIITDFFK
ncbi:MAG: D-2-hydroxyacid dehydrogenase [Firmicutes bacterium]|nr:D-2-hydroxyacid dehydrogenase [Bacillota bacterium]